MGKSKRDSPCPGCTVVKSMHTFGKPGKDCEGPPEDATPPATGPKDSPDVLPSILAAVEGLKQQVSTLQQDQADLRALVISTNTNQQPTTSANQVASAGTPTL